MNTKSAVHYKATFVESMSWKPCYLLFFSFVNYKKKQDAIVFKKEETREKKQIILVNHKNRKI